MLEKLEQVCRETFQITLMDIENAVVQMVLAFIERIMCEYKHRMFDIYGLLLKLSRKNMLNDRWN